jgi:hypothetical protein
MRLPSRQASLLLLLLPALAAAVTDSTNVAPREEANLPSAADAATKVRSDDTVAPVDRNDGKPHNGPWVKTDGKVDQSLPELQNRPEDPMVVDGKKIPQSNDGVMDDPTRKPPKEGTTGTEGGVSEKGKARKEQDGGATPEAPKDHPPLPHSEQEKIKATGDSDSGVWIITNFPVTCLKTNLYSRRPPKTTARSRTVVIPRKRQARVLLTRLPKMPRASYSHSTPSSSLSR